MLEYKGIREGNKLLFCDNGIYEKTEEKIEEKLSNYNMEIESSFNTDKGLAILVSIDPLRAQTTTYINDEAGRFRNFYYHILAKTERKK